MHSSRLIKLFVFLIIYQRVSSGCLFSKNETHFENNFDNVLRKFFVDLNKSYFQKDKPRHITVVGASSNEFQQTQPLLETYPYVICERPRKCQFPQDFGYASFVIVFLEDLSDRTFGNDIKFLSDCRTCKILFVSNRMIKVNDIWLIFTLSLGHLQYSEFAQVGKNVIKIYSDFVTTNCSMEVKLVTVYRPGVLLDNMKIWTSRSHDFNGCPVSVSSLHFTPKMMIKESDNGSLTIRGGREGNLVLTLAKKLNFTIDLEFPSMEDQLKYSRKEAIINDVASGISEIGIGRLRPNNQLNNSISLSLWYDEECVTWGVPSIIIWSNEIIWVEFTGEVWALIGFVFAISCIIGYVHRCVIASRNDEEKSLGFMVVFFEVTALHLGNPVLYVSTSAGGRFFLTACLYYAMVISTAYKSSLASILTTDEGTPSIVDVRGIINENLKLGGSLYDYNILKDQVNDSDIHPQLIERFTVNNNDSKTWEQMMFDNDYAYLARRSALDYDRQRRLKNKETLTYTVLNGCVLAYPTVMVFQKKSFLREPVNNIIWHLVESGILKHWDGDRIDPDQLLKRRSVEKYFDERGTHKFRNIFILYFFCITVALCTFFLELLTPRLDLRRLRHIAN